MSRIYLDSNVFSNLRTNKLPKFQTLNVLLDKYKPNLSFFFSQAHILDKKKDKTNHKYADFKFMEGLTKDNYLIHYFNEKYTSNKAITPADAWVEDLDDDTENIFAAFEPQEGNTEDINSQLAQLKSILNQPIFTGLDVGENLSEDQKKLLDTLIPVSAESFSIMEILNKQLAFKNTMYEDNLAYKELRRVFEEGIINDKYAITKNGDVDFSEALKDSNLNKSFWELVSESTKKNENENYNVYDYFMQSFQSLDILSIEKDKITKKNGLTNVLNDGLHAYYAQFCDYLITDDGGLTAKTKALYPHFAFKTKILSVDEFIAELTLIGPSSEENFEIFFNKIGYDRNHLNLDAPITEENRKISLHHSNSLYLNFFNGISIVNQDNHLHYIIRKYPAHYLSHANNLERGLIVNRAMHLFGSDLEGKGYFDFDYELAEIDKGTWNGRTWCINPFIIFLQVHPVFKEFSLMITPLETFLQESKTETVKRAWIPLIINKVYKFIQQLFKNLKSM